MGECDVLVFLKYYKKTSRYVSVIKRPSTHTRAHTHALGNKHMHRSRNVLSGDGGGAMGPTEYEISFAQKNENAHI